MQATIRTMHIVDSFFGILPILFSYNTFVNCDRLYKRANSNGSLSNKCLSQEGCRSHNYHNLGEGEGVSVTYHVSSRWLLLKLSLADGFPVYRSYEVCRENYCSFTLDCTIWETVKKLTQVYSHHLCKKPLMERVFY